MSAVSENGILAKADFEEYKTRSVGTKFRQQLLLGIGGATVFGLVSAFGAQLLELTATSAFAWAGLAAIAVVGIGCIYYGSKYLSESIMLDQDFQAKKIGVATRGKVPEIEEEQTKPVVSAPGMGENGYAEQVPTKQWAEKISPNAAPENWSERVSADASQLVRSA